MSLTCNNTDFRTNIFTLILFLTLFSSFNSLKTKTNSLEYLKLDLNSQINNYPFLKTGSKLDPESMQGLLSKMIELSQEPESEEQTKTFSIMIDKVRKLVDEMLKEQRESDITFKKNSAILIKYFIRAKNTISILQDKYDLNRKLLDLLSNIQATKGSLDVKVDYREIIDSLRFFNDYFMNFQARQTYFDQITSKYYDDVQQQIYKTTFQIDKNVTNPWNDQLKSLKSQIEDLPWVQATAVKNAFIMAINPDKEIHLLNRYISIFSSQQTSSSGTINKALFESLDERIKNAENESNNLSVKLSDQDNIAKTSKNSLNSYYDEYVKNTEKRSEIIKTILKILDFMNMKIKKVSVKFMVYLESTKDEFKAYVNSYEFVNFKKYIFKNILFDDEGKRLTEEYHKNK